jgi:hypothetical protein
MAMKVIWKDCKGYSNYEVSNAGFVRNKKTSRILKQHIEKQGYCSVKPVSDTGKQINVRVHRLVAEAFCKKKSRWNNVVDHIDGNKQNNKFSNLRWVTSFGNSMNYLTEDKVSKITQFARQGLTDEEIYQLI